MTLFSPAIPARRALVRDSRASRLPALRRVALAARPLQIGRVARAAGAVAVGLAAEGALRSLLARSEQALAPATAAIPGFAAAQPFEAAHALDALRRSGRLVITEFTVTERRWRR